LENTTRHDIKMEFKIENQEKNLEADILKISSNSEYLVKLQGKERTLKILSMRSEGIEFMLDNTYHFAKYLENITAKMTLVVDGVKVTFDKHSELNKIVYKNSGIESGIDSQVYLRSQIPGRVVSINVTVGDNVKKGDVICVLESMKMQLSIKSHRDGVIKTMKIKQGNSVAKNDVIVEIE
jgi:biotin carboxyl carrier protein